MKTIVAVDKNKKIGADPRLNGNSPVEIQGRIGMEPMAFLTTRPETSLPMGSRYTSILNDLSVRRWYQNVCRGSKITGDVYFRRLRGFCESNNLTPTELLKLGSKRRFDFLLDNVGAMESRGYAGSYIESVLKAVKSWLSFNGIEVRGKIKIRGARETPTLVDERVPTQDELRKILLTGDERSRVICTLVAHSGLRLGVLGDYEGNDGLRIKDFPEIRIDDGEIIMEKTPTLVSVRSSLSKKGHQYFTFLGSEGCEYLKAYLELRIRKGEVLTEGSCLISPRMAQKEFITRNHVSSSMRKAMRRAGFSWRPYVLRSYFATQMMLAESKGAIIRDWRAFFMGHKGDIEAVYTLNKRRLPPDVIEQMRQGYIKAQKYLNTIDTGPDQEGLTKAFKRQLMLVAGFKAEDIKDEHLDVEEDEFHKLVREKLICGVAKSHSRQELVELSQIGSRLEQGWEVVTVLPNNKAVMKRLGD